MKVDIGFWNEQGEYIPDIQEVNEVEMDKEFFNDIDNMVKVNKLEQENAELKAENERLKEEIKTLEQFLSKEPLALQALQKGYVNYKESTDVFYEMVKNYKQTLQEIKAIAEKLMADDLCNNCDGIGLDANCQDTGCPYYQMDRILDLITKAEEE